LHFGKAAESAEIFASAHLVFSELALEDCLEELGKKSD
jgi:hypothetical protein